MVGTTGAGKTTMARRLSERLGIPFVELDALHWGPDWAEPEREVFRGKVAAALAGDAWVVDGNYSKVRDLVWTRVETVVWLDYSFPRVIRQLLLRTLRRSLTGEELWQGNRERFWPQFFSSDSLLLWAAKTYRRRRAQYARLAAAPENADIRFVRLGSPGEGEAWLGELE